VPLSTFEGSPDSCEDFSASPLIRLDAVTARHDNDKNLLMYLYTPDDDMRAS
jgi:hypothetical protein